MSMSECIIYRNTSLKNGYGRLWIKGQGKVGLAHRAIFIEKFGNIPKGLEVHHICHNKLCLNVEHMVLMTRTQHALLSLRERKPKKFCDRGHIIDGRNKTQRFCLVCKKERQKKYANKNKDKINAYRRKWRKARKVLNA